MTGDAATGRLLGMQLVGHKDGSVAKRVDVAAAALFAKLSVDQVIDLDLAYTPPLGSPWDAVQLAGQSWDRQRPSRSIGRAHKEAVASPTGATMFPPLWAPVSVPFTLSGSTRIRRQPSCCRRPPHPGRAPVREAKDSQ